MRADILVGTASTIVSHSGQLIVNIALQGDRRVDVGEVIVSDTGARYTVKSLSFGPPNQRIQTVVLVGPIDLARGARLSIAVDLDS